MDLSCVELCIKSNFSFLNGGSHPEEYARRAVDFGLEAFAITDHNSVSGIVRAHTEIKKINAKIKSKYKLKDIDYSSGGPARYSKFEGSKIKLGFITPLSHNFCATCNRVRIDATGIMHQCLGQSNSIDFRKILRNSKPSHQDIVEHIKIAINDKPEKHSFAFDYSKMQIEGKVTRHMSMTGG